MALNAVLSSSPQCLAHIHDGRREGSVGPWEGGVAGTSSRQKSASGRRFSGVPAQVADWPPTPCKASQPPRSMHAILFWLRWDK